MKPVLTKLKIEIPEAVIELLKSKSECKTTFQLNKYIFFAAVIFSAENHRKELNSHNMYSTLMVNNAKGLTIKNNLIEWGILNVGYGVGYEKFPSGKFSANNCSLLYFNQKHLFGKRVVYTFYSNTAKFITKEEVYDLTNGCILEKVTEKELAKLQRNKVKPSINNTLKTFEEINEGNHNDTVTVASPSYNSSITFNNTTYNIDDNSGVFATATEGMNIDEIGELLHYLSTTSKPKKCDIDGYHYKKIFNFDTLGYNVTVL